MHLEVLHDRHAGTTFASVYRPPVVADHDTTVVSQHECPGQVPTLEQIGAVDARRLGELVGHLTHEELWGVDEALVAVLGLR